VIGGWWPANDNENKSNMDIVKRLKTFMENEARSCSMDFGCITPQYVYRMWGGTVPFDEIEEAMRLMVKD